MSRPALGLRIPEAQTNVIAGMYPVNLPLPELQFTRDLLITQRSVLDQAIGRFESAIQIAHRTPNAPLNPDLPQPTETGKRKNSKLAKAARARWAAKRAAAAAAGGTPAQPQATGEKKRRGRKPMTSAASA